MTTEHAVESPEWQQDIVTAVVRANVDPSIVAWFLMQTAERLLQSLKPSRETSLAKTKLEEAQFWLSKHR